MSPAERQQRWSALLAAKNEEITRLRTLAAAARDLALKDGFPAALTVAGILADCAPAWDGAALTEVPR